MYRTGRHNKILELIKERQIETQEDIALQLVAAGFKVTQATVSRDIKELGLIKISAPDGKMYYAKENPAHSITGRVVEIAYSVILSCNLFDKLIIFKTVSGFAKIVKSAVEHLSENAGCLADDDTIFVAFKDVSSCNLFYKKINSLIY